MADSMSFPDQIENQVRMSPLTGCVTLPGSKSITNRALLLAALSSGETHLINALFSDDTLVFSGALEKMGFKVVLEEGNNTLSVLGLNGFIPAEAGYFNIQNAGTAARFLTAFLTLGNGSFTLDGDARMRQRPIGHLLAALNQLGANVRPFDAQILPACPPVAIQANGLTGGQAHIAGDISSQFLSALLMVSPYAKEPVEILVTTELNSEPYVDLTLSMMADFGIDVPHDEYRIFHIQPCRYSSPGEYLIESDASSASYFFAAPAVCGGTVSVNNLGQHSRQGDLGFLNILEQMGCHIQYGEQAISVTRGERLTGIDVDMRNIPDTAPTLAAVAIFAETPTRIRGIASARVKESDRVSATVAELRKIGAEVDEHPDGMTIHPAKEPHGAVIETYNDHRIAMAFSVAGLKIPGVIIQHPACVSKTFPNFFEVLGNLA